MIHVHPLFILRVKFGGNIKIAKNHSVENLFEVISYFQSLLKLQLIEIDFIHQIKGQTWSRFSGFIVK